jgi:hypothetical protein
MSTSTNVTRSLLGRAEAQPSVGLRVGAWLTTGIFVALMTFSGVAYVVGPKPLIDAMRELGYPLYFLKLLGVAKLLGVIGLLAPQRPRLREWAYAGFTFDLVAAIASHLATGGATHVAEPLVVLALLVASYVLRRRIETASSARSMLGETK